MIVYPDTSLLVAAFTRETAHSAVVSWLAAHELRLSDWTVTEFSSALLHKQRTGELAPGERAALLEKWRSLERSSERLPVLRSHFNRAAAFLDAGTLTLRAGDALHLAVAAAHQLTLGTVDIRMAKAARELDIACVGPETLA